MRTPAKALVAGPQTAMNHALSHCSAAAWPAGLGTRREGRGRRGSPSLQSLQAFLLLFSLPPLHPLKSGVEVSSAMSLELELELIPVIIQVSLLLITHPK